MENRSQFYSRGTCADSLTQLNVINLDPGYGNTSISNWNWNLGNGLTSSLANPSLIYDSAGYYTIHVVFNGDNCPVIKDSITRKYTWVKRYRLSATIMW
ncbi:MAG: PKD domain-containing protein [Bacteroidota bacterium]